MKNDRILLNKLIDETSKNIITWDSSEKPDYSNDNFNYVKLKGEKNITNSKHIAFIINYYKYDTSECEVKIFLINDITKTRDVIYKIEPGFFSFKTKNLLEKLIFIITRKNKDASKGSVQSEIVPLDLKKVDKSWKELSLKYKDYDDSSMGPHIPPLKHVWDQEDSD